MKYRNITIILIKSNRELHNYMWIKLTILSICHCGKGELQDLPTASKKS